MGPQRAAPRATLPCRDGARIPLTLDGTQRRPRQIVEAAHRWRRPSALMALFPLRAHAAAGVRERLAAIGRNVEGEPAFPVASLSTAHFFRLLVTDDHAEPRSELGPLLLLGTVFDGTVDEHLQDLTAVLGRALAELFSACDDFEPGTPVDNHIRRHVVAHDLLHIGAVRSSLQDIRDEARLAAALGAFLDERMRAGAWKNAGLATIHRDCRQFVASHPELPQAPRAPRPLESRFVQMRDLFWKALLIAAPFGAIAAAMPWGRQSLLHWIGLSLALGLATFAAALLGIRILELVEPDNVPRIEPDTDAVEAHEDFQVQNQFTMLAPVRGSWPRRVAMGVTLWMGNLLSEHLWNRGTLAGVGTIHCARIYRLFDRRYILILSEYDGSWRRYLGDFLTVGAFAIVPIWAHLHGSPKTRFLYWLTPGSDSRFMRFTRTYQVPTQLWYSAYKNLTMTDILRAARIREGLFAARTDRDIQAWLREL